MWLWITDPITHNPQLTGLVAHMRPTRLSARLENLFQPGQPTFSEPFFGRITHLEIIEQDAIHWIGFELIPHLTHVHFKINLSPHFGPIHSTLNTVTWATRNLFEECPRLQVCVLEFVRNVNSMEPYHTPCYLEALEDDRVVYILQGVRFNKNWEALVWGQPDTWDFAEKRVTQQRRDRRRYDACYVYDNDAHGVVPEPTSDEE